MSATAPQPVRTPKKPRKPRLKRSNCSLPGLTRHRQGKGFGYYWQDGTRVEDPEVRRRIEELVIPPAWKDVWICPAANGHIQATGVDEAGRRQYLYHPRWRELKDREKFDHALDFGEALLKARPAVTKILRSEGNTDEKAYAAAFRLMDTGALRVGNEEYALTNGSYGVSTLQCRHLSVSDSTVKLDFPAKSGKQWTTSLQDADLAAALRPLLGRGAEEPALAYQNDDGEWSPITSAHLNEFVRVHCGEGCSAKDFRTWQGTITAAIALAHHPPERSSPTARKKAISAAMREVAEHLGNTAAIARSSYVDPRVLDRFEHGETLDAGSYRAAERSLRALVQ